MTELTRWVAQGRLCSQCYGYVEPQQEPPAICDACQTDNPTNEFIETQGTRQDKLWAYRTIFGANVKRYRKTNGWSEDQLAGKVMMTPSHIRSLEKGYYLASLHLIIELTDVFNCTANDLLKVHEDESGGTRNEVNSNSTAPAPNFITYQEVATMLNMPIGTIYSYVSKNEMPYHRFANRTVRFLKSEINEWIKTKRR